LRRPDTLDETLPNASQEIEKVIIE